MLKPEIRCAGRSLGLESAYNCLRTLLFLSYNRLSTVTELLLALSGCYRDNWVKDWPAWYYSAFASYFPNLSQLRAYENLGSAQLFPYDSLTWSPIPIPSEFGQIDFYDESDHICVFLTLVILTTDICLHSVCIEKNLWSTQKFRNSIIFEQNTAISYQTLLQIHKYLFDQYLWYLRKSVKRENMALLD